jgi:hypothetical protein
VPEPLLVVVTTRRLAVVVTSESRIVFKNLPITAKLILLCSSFVVAIIVAIDGHMANKMIVMGVARKELVETRLIVEAHGGRLWSLPANSASHE